MFESFHSFVQDFSFICFDLIRVFASILGVALLGGLIVILVISVIYELAKFVLSKYKENK